MYIHKNEYVYLFKFIYTYVYTNVWGLGFDDPPAPLPLQFTCSDLVFGLGFRIEGSVFDFQNRGVGVWGLRFGVWGLGQARSYIYIYIYIYIFILYIYMYIQIYMGVGV